jgi:hypothetical protein
VFGHNGDALTILKVDIHTGAVTAEVPYPNVLVNRLSVTFLKNGSSDSLHVSGYTIADGSMSATPNLYTVDPISLAPTLAGAITPWGDPFGQALTGTGDGRLYGLSGKAVDGNVPGFVYVVDPTTAQATSVMSWTLQNSAFLAAVFWGGDIWAFANTVVTGSSRGSVVHLKLATDKTQETVIEDIKQAGLGAGGEEAILAAAVSTCAPTTPVVR